MWIQNLNWVKFEEQVDGNLEICCHFSFTCLEGSSEIYQNITKFLLGSILGSTSIDIYT
jgi:hypothetical protein